MRRHTSYIVAGFALVLALVVGVSAVATSHMASINRRLQTIVNQHNTRADLVSSMRHNARERIVLMQAIAASEDLFERNEFQLRFFDQATRFVRARNQLLDMDLSEEERAILTRQGELTRNSVALQEQFLDLINADNLEEANRLLVREGLPSQNAVLAQLDELMALQRTGAVKASEEAGLSLRSAYLTIAMLGVAALAFGIAVAWLVTRIVARAQDEVFHEKELAQVTLHSIGDGVITTDAAGKVDFLNPVAERLTGWNANHARGLPLNKVFKVINESTREPIEILSGDSLLDSPAVGANQRILLINRREEEFAIENMLDPILSRDGEMIGLVLVFRDVTKARFLARQLSWQASHDALTGLNNRHEFERRLNQLLESARAQKRWHALLYMDLDQFKVVNDTCGHVAGDELLRQLAYVLREHIRDADVLARLGGDEFGVLLEACPLEQAQRIAETLREAVQDFRFVWLDKFFEIGASIGVVAISEADDSPAKILSTADAACYAAKDRGRNRVHVYEPGDQELAHRRGEMQWLARINKALDEDRFQLYYQAIVPLGEDTGYEHYEVLLAMDDGDSQPVPPMAFIPAAERYGLMPAIDRWVVRSVFSQQAALWRKRLARGDRFLCAINLSGMSLGDDAFLDYLREQIALHRVPARVLCFEVTETAAITNLAHASRFMRELAALGCRFALDDFGSGMSSFAYLKNLPVDFLKIDGAFVKDMAHDDVDFAMVDAINRIGHVLGIRTIAESVETPDILARLKVLAVDFAQGHAVHRPRPLSEMSLADGLRLGVEPTRGLTLGANGDSDPGAGDLRGQ